MRECRRAWKRFASRRWPCGRKNRYPSARRLADDLEHWLADEPISAQPDTRTQFVARWVRRHRSFALATAIALVLISVVSTVATVLVNQQREANLINLRLKRETWR